MHISYFWHCFSFDFKSRFFGPLFPYTGLVKWHVLGSLVNHGLQRCSPWISASQTFKIEEFYCFRICSYPFTVRLFNNCKFTVFLFLSFFVCLSVFWFFSPRSGCWLDCVVIWGGLWGVFWVLFVWVRRVERVAIPLPKDMNLFIFTVGINYYIWQWVWIFIHEKILLFVSVSLYEACLCPSEWQCFPVQGILS